jgi:hypothetical protein
MINFHFNPKKSAQAAAYLLRLNGGEMEMYLFIKMLYLADRESLKKWGEPITGDRTVSMKHGPILGRIYDLIKGRMVYSVNFPWTEFISNVDEESNRVFLTKDPGTDELSKSEMKILQELHSKFKNFTFGKMREFCHSLKEYEDVGGSSKDLPAEKILKAVGKSDSEITEIEESVHSLQLADMLLGRA